MSFKEGDELEVIGGYQKGRKCWYERPYTETGYSVVSLEERDGAFIFLNNMHLKKVENSEAKLTPELLNAEYVRRDGGEFKILIWCKELNLWLGIVKSKAGNWARSEWLADGSSVQGAPHKFDLIKKPVVREWESSCVNTLYVGSGCVNQNKRLQCYWKQEGNKEPELMRVEVVK